MVLMADGELSAALAQAAARMDESGGIGETVQTVTESAADLVPGCDYAGVFLRKARGRVVTVGATDEVVHRCDALQEKLQEGPCLEVMHERRIFLSNDLSAETRWPQWSAAVTGKESIGSVLSVQLFTRSRTYGALNLYSERKDAFSEESVTIAVMLAVHAAIAVRSASAEEELTIAVDSRTLVGQAQGILMVTLGMDAEAAFSTLSRVSQDTNTRLTEIAARIVRERSAHPLRPAANGSAQSTH